jgi:von Willebrand factor type A domain
MTPIGQVIVTLSVLVAGCGSSGSSEYSMDGGGDAGKRSDAGRDAPKLVFESGGGRDVVDSAACVTDHKAAAPSPADLVFIMDHSDSMRADSKWTSCSAALDSFFGSTKTTAVSASLTWLPSGAKASCSPADYETPAIPLTPLPSSEFKTAIKAEALELGTPTLAALTGSVTFATSLQAAYPGDKVLIILATDGKPAGCKADGNDVAGVAAEAAKALAAGVPTYVIGVGSATTNLDAIAAGGGTMKAFIVSTSDPGTTTREFEAAIDAIQETLGCDYLIPSPPGGMTIDYMKVNVELATAGGKETELTYSADCSDADGWHYDNLTSPTRIILCSGACMDAKSSTAVNIVFGCNTNGVK